MKIIDATLAPPGWTGVAAALVPVLAFTLVWGGLVLFVGLPWLPYAILLPLMLLVGVAGVSGVHVVKTPKAFALVFAAGIGATLLLACALDGWDAGSPMVDGGGLGRSAALG